MTGLEGVEALVGIKALKEAELSVLVRNRAGSEFRGGILEGKSTCVYSTLKEDNMLRRED